MGHPFSVLLTNGLYVRRLRTCPCGAVFTARRPTATYCTDACRRTLGRYGRPGAVVNGRERSSDD